MYPPSRWWKGQNDHMEVYLICIQKHKASHTHSVISPIFSVDFSVSDIAMLRRPPSVGDR
jgi:hypothetical protein